MSGRDHERHFVERILELLHMLREKGADIDMLAGGEIPEGLFSEQELAELSAAWDMLSFTDELPGGFFIYRALGDEEIIYANRGVLRIFQCEDMAQFRELTGGSFRGLVHPDDLEAVEESIRRQITASRQDLDYVEYRIRRRDGSVRYVEDFGHFVRSSDGDVFYVFLGDSTDERNQQQMEQKRLMADALEKANLAIKAKNTFLSNISHEMRTPLNAIFGFTALAKLNPGDTKAVVEYLEEVETASHRLLDMISHLLDMSMLSTAAGPAEEELELCRLMEETCDFLLPQAQEKDIGFSLDCSAVRHGHVYADQAKLRQLVLNLVNNAITYTSGGGRVTVSLSEGDELPNSYAIYRLEVSDTGIGISEEFIESIFEPFSREKNSTLSGIHGIGLGLTIARQIVDMLGGSIDVKSKVGEGSTFTVTLRLRMQPTSVVTSDDSAAAKPSCRILLVDDNELNREIETELLERMGFLIDPADNGQAALDKVRRSAPGDYDLIIMDLQMPVMDGWQASAAIRALPDPALARIPIIALSANVMVSDVRRSRQCGINAHLGKPMDMKLLLEEIDKLVGRR
ncbi:MAG: ATP-binding protein [Butyricicoccus sp.]|nr:ATP-binding protein [Butyricicoccus sp.]